MNKTVITFLIFSILLVGSVSAISVDYYFHPQCVHCEKIKPFIQESINIHRGVDWNIFDTSVTPFGEKTPTLFVKPNDGRIIKMVGSYEIPRYLDCELNEKSNLNCPTYSANECIADSWFIKE